MDALSTTRYFEWKIHNIKDFIDNYKENKWIESDKFDINIDYDTNWYFAAYLEKKSFSIYLFKNCLDMNYNVKLEAYIRGSENKLKFRNVLIAQGTKFEFLTRRGFQLFSFEELSNLGDAFLENGTLTLCLKIQLIKIALFEGEDSSCSINCQFLAMCKDLFETKSFSDIAIICADDVKVRAHRFILSAFSPVIKAMLNVKDSIVHIFEVRDISSDVMNEILRFMYTQKFQGDDTLLPKILYGAEKYKIDKLKESCVTKMIENLSVTNVFEYFFAADQYNIKVLLDDCIMFMKLYHDDLRMDVQWDKLEKKHWMMLLDCYRQNNENVHIFESTI